MHAYRELQQHWQQQQLQQQHVDEKQREGEERREGLSEASAQHSASLPALCPVWQIAENFRFEPAFERVRVQGEGERESICICMQVGK